MNNKQFVFWVVVVMVSTTLLGLLIALTLINMGLIG